MDCLVLLVSKSESRLPSEDFPRRGKSSVFAKAQNLTDATKY